MPRMPDDMAARYGALLDEFDASIKVLNDSKAETLTDLRGELKALGFVGAEISAEVAMLKGAVKVLGMTKVEQQKANDKDEGVSDYIAILSLARARAHVRHDADGVIIEDDETSRHGAGGAEDQVQVATERASSSAQPIEPQAQPVQTGAAPGTPTSNAGTEAVAAPAINPEIPSAEAEEADGEATASASPSDTPSEPAEGTTPTSAVADDRSSAPSLVAAPVVPTNVTSIRSHNPATHFLNSDGLARLHGCLKPELCGSGQPRVKLCFNCSVKHDGPTPQVEAG